MRTALFKQSTLILLLLLAVSCGQRTGTGSDNRKSDKADSAVSSHESHEESTSISGIYNPKSTMFALAGHQSHLVVIASSVQASADGAPSYTEVARTVPDSNNQFELTVPTGKELVLTTEVNKARGMRSVVGKLHRGTGKENKKIEIDETSNTAATLFEMMIGSREGQALWRAGKIDLSVISQYAASANKELKQVVPDNSKRDPLQIIEVKNAFSSLVNELLGALTSKNSNQPSTLSPLGSPQGDALSNTSPNASDSSDLIIANRNSLLTIFAEKLRQIDSSKTTLPISGGTQNPELFNAEKITYSTASSYPSIGATSISTITSKVIVEAKSEGDSTAVVLPSLSASAQNSVTESVTETKINSGCLITLDICQKYPQYAGVFWDSNSDASKDKDACLIRAQAYRQVCDNDASEMVSAQFYGLDGSLLGETKTTTACVISLASCRNASSRIGEFLDYYQDAATNQATCLDRAAHYFTLCRNQISEPVTASFVSSNSTLASKSTSTACIIEQEVCNSSPELVGAFLDPSPEATADAEVCMKEAAFFNGACFNSFSEVTKASYYRDGNLISSKDTSSGCVIEQTVCQAHPEFVGSFLDFALGSDLSKEACMLRALEINRWCLNSKDEITTAKYYLNSILVGETNTRTGCMIKLDSCTKHPEQVGYFIDPQLEAQSDLNVCLARVVDYHRWCGNGTSSVTTAEYFNNGTLLGKRDSATGCYIEQEVCTAHPDAVGVFLDNDAAAQGSEALCLRRAAQYARWCNNQFEQVTTARYLLKSQQTAARDTRQGCVINQQICSNSDLFNGTFVVYNNDADINATSCTDQAEVMHAWCLNSVSQFTTATYYDLPGHALATARSPSQETLDRIAAEAAAGLEAAVLLQAAVDKALADKAAADKAAADKAAADRAAQKKIR
jgi:hypothetical protein